MTEKPFSADGFIVLDSRGQRSTVLRNLFDFKGDADEAVAHRADFEYAPYSVVGCTVNYIVEETP